MKKTILALVLILAFGLSFVPFHEADAQLGEWEECTMVRDFSTENHDYDEGETYQVDDNEGEGALACMVNAVYRVINILTWFMVALVVLFVMYGGYKILTARGSEDDIAAGKKMITYAIVGVVIAAIAWAVPWMINFVIS